MSFLRLRLPVSGLLFFFAVIFVSLALVRADEANNVDAPSSGNPPDADADAEAALAAEEAAAAAVEEDAEDEEDEEADALDEDADSARYDPDFRHPLSEYPDSAKDISVGYAFISGMSSQSSPSPSSSQARNLVTLGEPVKTTIAFSNNGRLPYHVWGVMGSLNRDDRFDVYVQNFSYHVVNKTVEPNDELSFPYSFTPNARLDIRPFILAVTTFYEARGSSGNAIRGHSTTFFNATVDTRPGKETMSNSSFVGWFLAAIAAGVVAVYAFRQMENQQDGKKKREGSGSGEGGVTSGSDNNEWLADGLNLAKAGGGRGKTSGNSNSSTHKRKSNKQ